MASEKVKYMTREITHSKFKLYTVAFENGQAVTTEIGERELVGNVSVATAQTQFSRELGKAVTAVKVESNTETYRMAVEKFLELAEKVVPAPTEEPATTQAQ